MKPQKSIDYLNIALIILLIEKTVQHAVVTLAFYFNWGNIASTVVVNPNALMVSGALVAVLFGLSLYGAIRQQRWAFNLALGLAVFDIVGEFVAQGTFMIAIPISFIIAWILLALTIVHRRRK